MNEYITELLQRYRRAGIFLDTNILLLYFVGLFKPDEISRFKRTRTFTVEDYSTLISFLSHFTTIITTPNILTEVSNLSGQLAEHLKAEYFEKFAEGITLIEEHYLPSADISKMSEFRKFGLADAGIIQLRGKYLVITDDFRLSQYLQSIDTDVLNFNHIRVYNWT